jgi:hypothetical protein
VVPFPYGTKISTLTPNFLNFFAEKREEGGTRATGSVHEKYTIKSGLLVLRRLACDHQADASLGAEAVIDWDGTNNPIVLVPTAALPGTLTDSERFTLGPVKLENTTYSGVKSLEVDFGINVRAEGGDGDKWPTHVSISNIQPVIRLRGIDAQWLAAANIPLLGLVVTHANTTIYLRKYDPSGAGVYADNTANHVKMTVNGLAQIDTWESRGLEPVGVTMEIRPKFDGSLVPIVITTGQQIT